MADKKISQLTAAATPLAGTEVLPIVQSGTTVKVSSDNLTVKNVRSNATTGILQVTGPAAASTRVMTTPDANFTVARTDAAQTFTGDQTFGTVLGTTFDTNVAAAKVTLSGTTLAAAGTDTNIGITLTPKGTGNAVLTSGNLVVANGNGIDFSATPGTGTSELFDDYEEGTWTPAYDATAVSFTYTEQYGSYTKIGRTVIAQFRLNAATATGTTANPIVLTGLPFTSANLNSLSAHGTALGLQTFPSVLSASTNNNSSEVSLWVAGTLSSPTAANSVGAYLIGTAIYFSA